MGYFEVLALLYYIIVTSYVGRLDGLCVEKGDLW